MDLFSLVARLTLDRSQYQQGIGEAEGEAQGFASKLKGGLATAAKVGAAAVTAVGTAAAAMGTALVNNAGQVAAFGDNIDKASQKLGISATAYQEWDAVLQHSGTSIESMGMGMKTLANAAASGSDAFAELGISAERAAGMSREDLFAETITALQNVADENKRAQLAQELFGRSAMELGPLLNTSAADTQAMRDRVHELGGVMSDEAVKASAAYQDTLQDLQTAFEGTKRSLIAEFLPGITTVMDGLTAILTGDDGVGQVSEGIGNVITNITQMLPRVMQTGSRVVLALGEAIISNLPQLVRASTQTVVTLINGIIGQLPAMVEAGLEIIVSLANAIAENLPTLTPTIVEVVMRIVEILTQPDTLSALIDASVAIIIALAEGLINAIPTLLESVPVIIANLVDALISNVPRLLEAGVQLIAALAGGIVQSVGNVINAVGEIGRSIIDGIGELVRGAWDWGKDLINNFVDGIKAFIHRPIEAISGLAQRIRGFLGFSEPEEGPLSNFHTFAPDMMQLFAQGIDDNRDLITRAVEGAFDIRPTINASVNPSGGGQEIIVPRQAGAGEGGRNSAVMQVDRTVFARLIFTLYNEEAARVGVNVAGGAY